MQTSPFTPCDLPTDAIEMGGIAAPWGVKGWFKLHTYNASAEALLHARDWYLLPSDRPRKKAPMSTTTATTTATAGVGAGALAQAVFTGCVRVRVREVKPHGVAIVAQIRDVDDRGITEALQGSRIFVPRSAFPPPMSPITAISTKRLTMRPMLSRCARRTWPACRTPVSTW